MHREAFIEKLTEIQQTVEQLLAQLQASEHDKFAAHLYRSRREYRSACERAGKSGKQIERCVISTFQVAESMGFKGEFRQWEHSATRSQIGLRSPDFLRNSETRRCECLCNHMKPTITKRLNISQ